MANDNMFIAQLSDDVRIAYIDACPEGPEKGVILLIHGFPQTSYQFRKVIPSLAAKGYRVIAPDYRGAGQSSKPEFGFTKTNMAADLEKLLTSLSITQPVHVVGHDIGGMIAYAFASHYPERTASVIWGECPLPGTAAHQEDRTTHNVQQFHFIFHSVIDLPEALVAGREEVYLNHFFSKLTYNALAISQEDLDHYVKMYRQPGALRCAFNIYRAFPKDGEENLEWISKNGRCKVRALALIGAQSRHTTEVAKEMMKEVHEESTYRVAEVPGSGHYIAEENPSGFVQVVIDFIEDN